MEAVRIRFDLDSERSASCTCSALIRSLQTQLEQRHLQTIVTANRITVSLPGWISSYHSQIVFTEIFIDFGGKIHFGSDYYPFETSTAIQLILKLAQIESTLKSSSIGWSVNISLDCVLPAAL